MSTEIIRRPASGDEHATMASLLASCPGAMARWRRGAGNAVALWASGTLALTLAWLALGWVAGKLFGVRAGPHDVATLWFLALCVPVCAVFAVVSSVRWVRGWRDLRPHLTADLASAEVLEEHYDFEQAKRFQEPEHGGLVYFLRTAEGLVFTSYDFESQQLGANDEGPLTSRYRPQARLVIVRAPSSGLVLCRQASGAILNAGEPVEIGVDPDQWPSDDEPCSIPWDQLEVQLGTAAN